MQGNGNSPLRFFLERWIQRGVFGQLLLMTCLVAVVALVGGLLAFGVTSSFASAPEAIWWAFLRLTDPGYLGDDEGAVLRVISTTITVLGYVLFMGSLMAIMTQWLSRTLTLLGSGVTPISMKNHIVILGWTNRTPEAMSKLLSARGRLKRFLEERDARKLRIVVLSEEAGPERRHELREQLGEQWAGDRVLLRSGSSLRIDHLERLDLKRAGAILIPGADFELGGSDMTDTRVIKTLITLKSIFRSLPTAERPHVVAEIFDPRRVQIARDTLNERCEIVASNLILSRLISQSIRHHEMGPVLLELLSHRQGNSLYLRSVPQLAGQTLRSLSSAFENAIPLGILRQAHADGSSDVIPSDVIMDPWSDEALTPEDLVILLAETYDLCQPRQAQPTTRPIPHAPRTKHSEPAKHRILILGWSHKIGTLISELSASALDHFEVTIMSRTSLEERESWLTRIPCDSERIELTHVLGDYSIETELIRQDPMSFDHIALLASEWMETCDAADARTILGYALLSSMTSKLARAEPDASMPEILVEILEPDNAHLFQDSSHVVLISPRVLSHLLAHVALKPELNRVFDELFGPGGSELGLRPAETFGLVGRTVSFAEIREAAFQAGMTALGIRSQSNPTNPVCLNPDSDRTWSVTHSDRIVVLASDQDVQR